MHKRLLIPALLILSLAIAVPLAAAKIAPQKGIQGIYLLKTAKEVVAKKGEPDKEKVIQHPIIGDTTVMTYGMTKAYFNGDRAKSEVISVKTKDPEQRTDTGVGVGSSKREVKRGVEGVECEKVGGFHHCYKGAYRAGKRVTDFVFNKDNDVKYVRVGIVID